MSEEKLDHLCKEVIEFMEYIAIVSGESQVNIFNLTKQISPFYELNKDRCTKEQLVNQFLKRVGGVAMIKQYSQYKKL